MKKEIFRGSAAAVITPFTPDGRDVDLDFFRALLHAQLAGGTDAVVVAGTTGESPVLTGDEKRRLFQCAVSELRGRLPVIAGTGSNDTWKAVRASNEAEKEGVDGLLIVTPFYNKCTQEGVVRHYHTIADRVSTPVIVYNVPSRTGLNIKPETYQALAEHKNIVAVKEANGDLSAAAKTASLCGDALTMYSGNDDQTVAMMALGAKGVISVAANAAPGLMHAVTQKALQNDLLGAGERQASLLRLTGLLFSEVNPIPIKAAVSYLYGRECPLRLPLTPMSEDKKRLLIRELDRLGLSAKQ